MQLPKGTLLQGGKYRIEEKIGQGGFGITYRACQPLMLGRKVCIKEFCLKQHFSREATSSAITYPNDTARRDAEIYQQKFIKEAQTLYSMHHPNIMEIYDIFEENNTAYYVMEYVEGESLKGMLESRGCIPEAEAIGYIRKVAEALKYIHSRNINHFDVKPGNILVRSNDKEVILIDFGTAKHYDSKTGNATTKTSGMLSPGYAPIEQYQQGGINIFTPETDIYALGATFYKLLTGITPPEPSEIISNGIPELPPSVSKATKDLIKWSMQLNKKDRPRTCYEFLRFLPINKEFDINSGTSLKLEENEDSTICHTNEETINLYSVSTIIDEKNNYLEDEEHKKKGSDEKTHKIAQKSSKKNMWIGIILGVIIIASIIIGINLKGINSTNKDSTTRDINAYYSNGVLIVDSVTYDMVRVQSGTFTMGATSEIKAPREDEKPAHQVTITHDYYIGKTEVTQALWKAVMGSIPRDYFKGDNLPVAGAYFGECQQFISRLNSMTGQNFRLPTEAEWEFAARGGNNSKHYQYSGSNNIDDVAWYCENSGYKTHPVATKQPNELGIYDMSGNVVEWCSDWYGNYDSNAQTNPTGSNKGTRRLNRGGGWLTLAFGCSCSVRYDHAPNDGGNDFGLRLVLSEPNK